MSLIIDALKRAQRGIAERLPAPKKGQPKQEKTPEEERLEAELARTREDARRAEEEIRRAAAMLATTERGEAVDYVPGEREAEREVEKLSGEDRERIGWGLSTIGFKVEKAKNEFWGGVFDKALGKVEQKGTAGKFFNELRNSFVRDAEEARKKGVAIQEGKEKAKLRNMGLLAGNVLKYGRIVADVTGASIANPLRYVMMGGMITARAAEAGKEARFQNEELIEKTRIQDADKAAEEAWAVYEDARRQEGKMGNENVSAKVLKEAYVESIPASIWTRLQNPGTANSFLQKILKWDFERGMNYINNSIAKIWENKKLSVAEKEAAVEKLYKKQEKRLLDFDRMLSQYGTVDGLAMATRYAQTAGKTIVAGMQIETAVISIEKLWEKLSEVLSSHTPEIQEAQPSTPPLFKVEPVPEEAPSPAPEAPVETTPVPRVAPPPEPAPAPEPSPAPVRPPEPTPAPAAPVETIPPPEPAAPPAPRVVTPPEAIETTQRVSFAMTPEAIVQKGEGIEHAFRRQIEGNFKVAQSLGYRGAEGDAAALREFSGRAAHRIALDKGYVDRMTGAEIRVRPAGEVAYQLGFQNGEPKVQEFRVEGKALIEEHGNEPEFEGDRRENYEDVRSGPARAPATVVGGIIPGTKTTFAENFLTPEEARRRMLSKVTFGEISQELKSRPATIPMLTEEEIRANLARQFQAQGQGAPEPAAAPAEPAVPQKPTPEETLKEKAGAQIEGTQKPQPPKAPERIIVTGRGEGGQNYIYDNRVPIYDQFGHTSTRVTGGARNYIYDNRVPIYNSGYGRYYGGGMHMGAHLDPNAEAIRTLGLPSEFAENHYNLSADEMKEVFVTYRANIERILPTDKSIDWSIAKNLSAREVMKPGGAYSGKPGYEKLLAYLEELKQVTGEEPKGGLFRKEESLGKYITRALEKAKEEGELGAIRMPA